MSRWSYDPLNSAAEFTYATQCQIAAILMLGAHFFAKGGLFLGGSSASWILQIRTDLQMIAKPAATLDEVMSIAVRLHQAWC